MEEKNETVVAVVDTAPRTEGEAELSKAVTEIEFQAESIVISTEEDYQNAGEFGRLLKKKSAEVTAFFAPMISITSACIDPFALQSSPDAPVP